MAYRSRWHDLADQVLAGDPIGPEAARAILEAPDDEILDLLAAGFRLRTRYYGRYVRFHYLINVKSGLCPEDCHYCSQSRISTASIERYPLVGPETILAGAARAVELGATTYCIVASGRGPVDHEIDRLADVIADIRRHYPLRICACLGQLRPDQAARLKEAGVERYNHNLNTSEAYTPAIVTTHAYAERVATVERVKAAGLSPCSGLIVGMGESLDDRVAVAMALRDLDVDSIPINFLIPIPGTPFADRPPLPPTECLKVVAMMRFVHPTKEIRLAGGREVQLRSLQALGLYVANSLFVADYLTTPGQPPEQDHQMVRDMGFEVEPPGVMLPYP
ncbi:MAG: biotin synthase BioB [Actinomycetia bacterium]|nr:biotin synthase BioB [Actinomycetes bacterium]